MEMSVLVVVFMSFLGCFQLGLSQSEVYMKAFITWDDMKVDEGRARLSSRDNYNRSRVIVVDKNGGGDSLTVQGAIDMNTVVAVPGGYGMQAVALRVSGEKAFFYKVRMLGTQDTLLDETGSHYFYQCHIQGSVDFIFGRGKSLFQDCILQSTAKKTGAIAAHRRDSPYDDTGFSFVGCVINGTGKVLLGRAWGNYSRAIYSFCNFDHIIIPAGWSDWNNPHRQKTVVFGEYECSGRGADIRGRVPWLKTFTYEEVKPFLGMQFINGDQWLKL
ncbi:hypothetical protein GH714_006947 [Hevea brasiliensis]|uniref:Pectinesterase n=1 Tax=Hevea brasiliensis TaxID=3981 RepID=A0A6A6LZW6_HEVBR|nr:hypothetical protein GH714_006947 [Hevea brasiliensis]